MSKFKKVTYEDDVDHTSNNTVDVIKTLTLIMNSVLAIVVVSCLIAFFVDYTGLSDRNMYLKKNLKVDGTVEFDGTVIIRNAVASETITNLVVEVLTAMNITTTNLAATTASFITAIGTTIIANNGRVITFNATTGTFTTITATTVNAGYVNTNGLSSSDHIIITGTKNIATVSVPMGTLYTYFADIRTAVTTPNNANVGTTGDRFGTVYTLYVEVTNNINAATINGVSDPKIKQNIVSTNETETLRKLINTRIVDYNYNTSYALRFNKPLGLKVTGLLSTEVRDNIDSSLTYEGPLDLSLDGNSPNVINVTYVDKLAFIPLTIKGVQVSLRRLDVLKGVVNLMKLNGGYSNPVIAQMDALLTGW